MLNAPPKDSEDAESAAPPLPERAGPSTLNGSHAAEEANQATINAAPPSQGMSAARANDTPAAHSRRAKSDAKKAHILEGSVQKGVLMVALPSVATMLLQTTNTMLDRFMIGAGAGPAGLAAITTASTLMFALMSAGLAISVGTTALVARFIGERNIHDARRATKQSLLLALVISAVVGVPMLLLRIPLLTLLGLDADARDLAARYLLISICGLPSLFLMVILNGAFRGLGDTARPFWVTLGANLIHASFNYLLIFGNFGFPRMGLPGGALALVLSQIMAVILYIVFLRTTTLRHALTHGWKFDWEWAKRISRIGVPASFQQLIRVGSMLAFQGLITRIGGGDDAVAALGVGLVSESIAFMPGFGYSIAASAFVGQNLGAKQIDRANKGAWTATYQAVAVMTVMGLIFYHFAPQFAHIFVRHAANETPQQAAHVEDTIRLTIMYLKTAAYSEPFLAFAMVLTGALQGAGETVSPTVVTVATMIGLRLPLAYFLSVYLGYGIAGAWWAMSASTIVQGILIILLFRRGKWRTIKV